MRSPVNRPSARVLITRGTIGLAFYALAGWFLWRTVSSDAIAQLSQRLTGITIALVVLSWLAARWLMALVWGAFLYPQAKMNQIASVWRVYAVTALGKYVPGKLLTIAARVFLSHRLRVSASKVIISSAREVVLNISMAFVIGGMLCAWTFAASAIVLAMLGMLAAFLVWRLDSIRLTLRIPFIVRPLEWGRESTPAAPKAVLALSLTAILALLLGSIVLGFGLIPELTWPRAFMLAASYLISSAVGVLVVLAPAGIGAREIFQYKLFASSFGADQMALFLLVARILDVAADLLFAGIGMLGFLIHTHKTSDDCHSDGHS